MGISREHEYFQQITYAFAVRKKGFRLSFSIFAQEIERYPALLYYVLWNIKQEITILAILPFLYVYVFLFFSPLTKRQFKLIHGCTVVENIHVGIRQRFHKR